MPARLGHLYTLLSVLMLVSASTVRSTPSEASSMARPSSAGVESDRSGSTATGANEPAVVNTSGASAVDLVGSYGGSVEAVAVVGTLVYIGEGGALTILDVSDPAQPVRRARLALGHVLDIVVADGVAYIAGGPIDRRRNQPRCAHSPWTF